MILSVKQTEYGLIVLVQKTTDEFYTRRKIEWVNAGQDEINEVCARLMRESILSRSGRDKEVFSQCLPGAFNGMIQSSKSG